MNKTSASDLICLLCARCLLPLWLSAAPGVLAADSLIAIKNNPAESSSASRNLPIVQRKEVPLPITVDTGRSVLGAVMCPIWRGGSPWKRILKYSDREPVLGWYDEGNPEVTDWEIKFALDHGISFFLVCWYRQIDNFGKPVKPALEHWLRDGLFHSRYGNDFKFAINFENDNRHYAGQTSENDLLQNLLPFWIENYFRRTNYLVLDGKPVLAIYNVKKLVQNLGGEARAKAAISKLRAACLQAGFKGVYLFGQYCWGNPDELSEQAGQIQRVGMDAGWSYHLPTFTGAFANDQHPSGTQAIAAQDYLWRTLPSPHLLTLSMGWDSEPWGFSLTQTQWRLTPVEFKELCQRAKSILDERKSDGIANRIVLFDNWNEFGEGHYIFPTRQYGFGYLDAVREVFTTNAPPHVDLVPQDVGLGPYDSAYRTLLRQGNDNN